MSHIDKARFRKKEDCGFHPWGGESERESVSDCESIDGDDETWRANRDFYSESQRRPKEPYLDADTTRLTTLAIISQKTYQRASRRFNNWSEK